MNVELRAVKKVSFPPQDYPKISNIFILTSNTGGFRCYPWSSEAVFVFQWCPPLNKSRRLRVHAEHWWAQGCICALAWGFVPLSNIVYSFGPQPRALRISSCRQQKHRRVLIKASVGLAFRASGTTSDICSRSP